MKKIGIVLSKNKSKEISKTVDEIEKKYSFYKKRINNLKKKFFLNQKHRNI